MTEQNISVPAKRGDFFDHSVLTIPFFNAILDIQYA
jgi:hypothetical protein